MPIAAFIIHNAIFCKPGGYTRFGGGLRLKGVSRHNMAEGRRTRCVRARRQPDLKHD